MRKKLIALWFMISLALMAGTMWVVYRNMVNLVETSEEVNHTLEILSTINDLKSQILEAESAKRGFVITGKPVHLDQFTGCIQRMRNLVLQLRTLTRNDPIQHSRLERLEPLIDKKIVHFNRFISLRQHREITLSEQIAMTDAGKVIHEDIRQILDDVEKVEKQQLWQRYVERTHSAQQSLLNLALGTIISFGMLALVFWYLNREILGRIKAEGSVQRANRTLKTLSESKQALIRATNETELLGEICRILVVEGGYRLVWVGLALADQGKTVRPVARFGVDAGYVDAAAITYQDAERGQGPFGMALRRGQTSIVRNIQEDRSFAPWRDEALKRGFASACVFPLKIEGQLWGGIAIYAGEPDRFDTEEVKLLEELAQDLEYGIKVLRGRAEHQQAVAALAESEAQYRLLVENLNHGLVISTPDGLISYVNPKLGEMLGYEPHELTGHQIFDFLDRTNQEIIRDQVDRRQRGERTPYELVWTRKDGEKIIVLITPILISDQGGGLKTTIGVVTDITDHKQAESQAQEHLHSLSLLMAGLEKLTKLRDPDATVQEICQLVADAFDTRLVWLGRVASPGCLRPLYWAGEMADCLKDREICLEVAGAIQEAIGQAIQTGKPILVNDVSQEAEGMPGTGVALERGYQALAVFPLMSDSQTFACLNIYSDQPGFFTPERVDLLQAFARIAAAALESVHLNAKVEKHLKQVQALRQIDLAISSSLDLRITLNVLLDHLTGLLRVDAATVMLLNPHTLALGCAAVRGFRSNAINQIQVSLGKGCAGVVALERKPLAIPELAAVQDKCTRDQLFASEHFFSYYGVPLINKGQVRGVVEIFHRNRWEPDEDTREFLEAMAGQAAIAIDNATLVDEMHRAHLDLSLAYEATLEGWARALELRDFETKGHSHRVTEMTVKLAQALGVENQDLTHIYRGALLHDIGKIAVPDSILLKPGPLTPDEWVIMRQHPIYAYDLLSPITYLRPALDIPYCHHERWDGSGYPRGLKGEEIPLSARIFAVVDVWDALSNDRPYRPAWPCGKVRAYLRKQAGIQFDPKVVDIFLEKFMARIDTAA